MTWTKPVRLGLPDKDLKQPRLGYTSRYRALRKIYRRRSVFTAARFNQEIRDSLCACIGPDCSENGCWARRAEWS